MMSLGIVMDQVDDLVTNAGGGIGDCTGGFYRSMAAAYAGGDEWFAQAVAIAVKAFLLVLPALCACQWLLRAYKGSKAVMGGSDRRNRWKRWRRVFTRFWLGVTGVLQVCLLVHFDLNASHGGLINFWLAFLFGA